MSDKKAKKNYTNGEITVHWDASLCYHSGNCVRGLSKVFNPQKRPWIDITAASSEEIAKVVDTCPSGALSYTWNDKRDEQEDAVNNAEIRLKGGGPILVKGNFTVIDEHGNVIQTKTNVAFCRCSHSGNLPFCDGSHRVKKELLEN